VDRDDVPLTMLTHYLGCDLDPDYVITDVLYDSSLINVASRLGAFGDAFFKDDILIAFKQSSTFLTGTIDDDDWRLEADDGRTYSVATDAWDAFQYASLNGGPDEGLAATLIAVEAFYVDDTDGDVVTFSVRVSGSTIRDVYAVLGWQAIYTVEFSDDDLDEFKEDETIGGDDFPLNDDGDIDYKQFVLIGANSLSDIKKDDVVYTYTDGDVIRKVAVSRATVEGFIEEGHRPYHL
jgi:hypothetical protein